MTTQRQARLDLSQISLREKERAFVVGGTESGKSTIADWLRQDFLHRYATRGARALILDSKPRYRAQYTSRGLSAAERYKGWDHGPTVPGSVVVDSPDELAGAWRMGARTVIAQCESGIEIPRLVATAKAFLKDSKASRPQLVHVDETLDFFHSNGSPRGGDDTIAQLARAGRERGTAVEYCAQRTHGIPASLMGEMMRLYAFRIDYKRDAKRLHEMGAPADMELPTEPHRFLYWYKRDYHRVHGPFILTGDVLG